MELQVEAIDGGSGKPGFRVEVEGQAFAVTVAAGQPDRLGAPDPVALIRASFEFLLAREPVTAILPSFDLSIIERYFPEWPETMRRRFGGPPINSEG